MSAQAGAAGDPYARFAPFYDLEYDAVEADLDFYRQFAVQAGGPVLELGCGTGRVLRALQETRLPLAGIDVSPSMLARARMRLGEDVLLVQCPMDEVGECSALAGQRFWLAFSAINTFLHLPDASAQLRTLAGLRRVVVTGGLLLLDLLVPDAHYLASLDGRLQHELAATLPDGRRLDKWAVRSHDAARQMIDTTVYFDVTDPQTGRIERVIDRYLTRYIHRYELEHLLARAGWELIALYGGYDLEPFGPDAERMLALATWGDMRAESEGER